LDADAHVEKFLRSKIVHLEGAAFTASYR